MRTYAFIDASNIIYGTRDEGWKVDFKKLFKYLKEIKILKGIQFNDLGSFRQTIEFHKKRR